LRIVNNEYEIDRAISQQLPVVKHRFDLYSDFELLVFTVAEELDFGQNSHCCLQGGGEGIRICHWLAFPCTVLVPNRGREVFCDLANYRYELGGAVKILP
jgi:hypothetical protein